MASIEFDFSDFKDFFERLKKAANGDLKKEMQLFLEGSGVDFLRIVQDEIIRLKVMDTRLMLSSFRKGSFDNVWILSKEDLTLTVGTNVEYASYVNDGHWTCGNGETSRFVPGVWNGDSFQYIPGAKTGMVLKQKWVEGRHYWESAMNIWEKIFSKSVEAKLQQWIDDYFGL